jgi:hypothetical protein
MRHECRLKEERCSEQRGKLSYRHFSPAYTLHDGEASHLRTDPVPGIHTASTHSAHPTFGSTPSAPLTTTPPLAMGHKVIGLVSGGKDSCFNLLHCVANGHEIVALATLTPEPGTGASR